MDISNQLQYLRNVKYHDVNFFSLQGYKTWAKCVKIYDGDSATFVFFFNDNPYKFKIRLAEIDTPEIRSTNPNETVVALQARDRLKALIGDKLVYLECLEYDKYGRILAKIYNNGDFNECYNKILVDEGLAYQYDGGHKKEFTEWYNQ